MTRESQITQSLPPAIQKVSRNLQLWGFWSFWLQLVLGIISAVTLLFATPALFEAKENTRGIQFGIFFSFYQCVVINGSYCFSFSLW